MWYRPVRERPVDLVVESAVRALAATGCDEVSLISLSSCDYSGIEDAVRGIRERRPDVRISLPSLRLDSAAVGLARLGGDQRGSVTLAPEAATQELRDAINKRVDDGQFLEAVRAAYGSGFTGVKLYFMIGLPGESDEDVRAIAAMAAAALGEGRRLIGGRAQLSVSVSSFVPKPQTPLQWEPFAGADAIVARQELLRAAMPRGVRLSLPRRGRVAGRGDAGAWRRGAGEAHRRRLAPGSALRRLARALRPRRRGGEPPARQASTSTTAVVSGSATALPWDVIDARIAPRFLHEERDAVAVRGAARDDCRFGACSECGACVGEIEMDLAG